MHEALASLCYTSATDDILAKSDNAVSVGDKRFVIIRPKETLTTGFYDGLVNPIPSAIYTAHWR